VNGRAPQAIVGDIKFAQQLGNLLLHRAGQGGERQPYWVRLMALNF
jgi:hypothetical protein